MSDREPTSTETTAPALCAAPDCGWPESDPIHYTKSIEPDKHTFVAPAPRSPAETDADHLTTLGDQELEVTYGNALADLSLAERYEHNRHLVEPIKRSLDRIVVERKRRAAPSAPEEPRAEHPLLLARGLTRDWLGERVREAWVRWATTQANPKPSWLVPWDGLGEADREADRQIGEAIALWTIAHPEPAPEEPATTPEGTLTQEERNHLDGLHDYLLRAEGDATRCCDDCVRIWGRRMSALARVRDLADTAESQLAALREENAKTAQRAIMEAIELTVKACDADERAKVPREAREVDYAGILTKALGHAAADTVEAGETLREDAARFRELARTLRIYSGGSAPLYVEGWYGGVYGMTLAEIADASLAALRSAPTRTEP